MNEARSSRTVSSALDLAFSALASSSRVATMLSLVVRWASVRAAIRAAERVASRRAFSAAARTRCTLIRARSSVAATRLSWRPMRLRSSRLSSRSENDVVPSAKEIRLGESDS